MRSHGFRQPRAEVPIHMAALRPQMIEANWPGGIPPMARHHRSSLAWRMCLVAEGRFDTMLTFRKSYEWDLAAGALILSEAGVTAGIDMALAMVEHTAGRGDELLTSFQTVPHPRATFAIGESEIVREVLLVHGEQTVLSQVLPPVT